MSINAEAQRPPRPLLNGHWLFDQQRFECQVYGVLVAAAPQCSSCAFSHDPSLCKGPIHPYEAQQLETTCSAASSYGQWQATTGGHHALIAHLTPSNSALSSCKATSSHSNSSATKHAMMRLFRSARPHICSWGSTAGRPSCILLVQPLWKPVLLPRHMTCQVNMRMA